ncbi:MAG: Fe(3+)-hydroxamate ABC transporter permease FhuB [Neisseria sp.]|uniref:Fe(3+)-hydroxamate ABC transporter permease FhuB n=1 Tax=Neisseria sp. TaxID=192066 RepID=UPI0026DB67C7|nr:Fe(3+)-hydroxamate ABC transporter permease FhuB [Neisseria sp.]MDO4641847.1 Fe(3+)-hydroxamate ABC transporter permease FhuB [Neisseria sp.]
MVKAFQTPAMVLLVLLAGCLFSSGWIVHLQWTQPWAQLFAAPASLPLDALMVQQNTLPRMAMALLAGGSLAVATMLMQQVMRNPLASDSTLAVSGGAQLALLLVAVFFPALQIHGTTAVGFIGAAAALAAVLALSARREMMPLTVVLAGLVMSLYLGSINYMITLFYSEESRGLILWGSGSLVQDSWHDSLQLSGLVVLAAVVIGVLVKPLNIMSLSDTQAASLGIPVKTVRLTALAAAALLSAGVVSMVGMMGFVGLAGATAVRQAGIRTLTARLLASFAVGGMMLLLTDNGLVLLNHYRGIDLSAGALTALIGAPLLLWLMARMPSRAVVQVGESRPLAALAVSSWLRRLPYLLLPVLFLALTAGHNDQGWHLTFDREIWGFRYPRLLLAAGCGMMLSTVGVLLQRLAQNPMASPELLGISPGTALGAMTAVMIFGVTSGSALFWLSGGAAALFTLGLMMWFNRKNGLQPEKVLLTGMALAALSDAAIRTWMALGDYRTQQLLIWLSGSTYHTTPVLSWGVMTAAVLLLVAVWPLHSWLALLSLDSVVAQSVGVNVKRARLVLILFSAVMTTAATLMVGPLSFVGLLAPHLAAMLGARLPRQQLLYAALVGATIMVLADWLGRQLMFPYEIPAGLMATLLGGAYFMTLVRKM